MTESPKFKEGVTPTIVGLNQEFYPFRLRVFEDSDTGSVIPSWKYSEVILHDTHFPDLKFDNVFKADLDLLREGKSLRYALRYWRLSIESDKKYLLGNGLIRPYTPPVPIYPFDPLSGRHFFKVDVYPAVKELRVIVHSPDGKDYEGKPISGLLLDEGRIVFNSFSQTVQRNSPTQRLLYDSTLPDQLNQIRVKFVLQKDPAIRDEIERLYRHHDQAERIKPS